eukprot:g5031.t1
MPPHPPKNKNKNRQGVEADVSIQQDDSEGKQENHSEPDSDAKSGHNFFSFLHLPHLTKAAEKVQRAYRQKKSKSKHKKHRLRRYKGYAEPDDPRKVSNEDSHFKVSTGDENQFFKVDELSNVLQNQMEAASKIQASYRGYTKRKKFSKISHKTSAIAGVFRRYKARQQVKLKQDSVTKKELAVVPSSVSLGQEESKMNLPSSSPKFSKKGEVSQENEMSTEELHLVLYHYFTNTIHLSNVLDDSHIDSLITENINFAFAYNMENDTAENIYKESSKMRRNLKAYLVNDLGYEGDFQSLLDELVAFSIEKKIIPTDQSPSVVYDEYMNEKENEESSFSSSKDMGEKQGTAAKEEEKQDQQSMESGKEEVAPSKDMGTKTDTAAKEEEKQDQQSMESGKEEVAPSKDMGTKTDTAAKEEEKQDQQSMESGKEEVAPSKDMGTKTDTAAKEEEKQDQQSMESGKEEVAPSKDMGTKTDTAAKEEEKQDQQSMESGKEEVAPSKDMGTKTDTDAKEEGKLDQQSMENQFFNVDELSNVLQHQMEVGKEEVAPSKDMGEKTESVKPIDSARHDSSQKNGTAHLVREDAKEKLNSIHLYNAAVIMDRISRKRKELASKKTDSVPKMASISQEANVRKQIREQTNASTKIASAFRRYLAMETLKKASDMDWKTACLSLPYNTASLRSQLNNEERAVISRLVKRQKLFRTVTRGMSILERCKVMAALIIKSTEPQRVVHSNQRTQLDRIEFQILCMELCLGISPVRVDEIFDALHGGKRNDRGEVAIADILSFLRTAGYSNDTSKSNREMKKLVAFRLKSNESGHWDEIMSTALLRHQKRRETWYERKQSEKYKEENQNFVAPATTTRSSTKKYKEENQNVVPFATTTRSSMKKYKKKNQNFVPFATTTRSSLFSKRYLEKYEIETIPTSFEVNEQNDSELLKSLQFSNDYREEYSVETVPTSFEFRLMVEEQDEIEGEGKDERVKAKAGVIDKVKKKDIKFGAHLCDRLNFFREKEKQIEQKLKDLAVRESIVSTREENLIIQEENATNTIEGIESNLLYKSREMRKELATLKQREKKVREREKEVKKEKEVEKEIKENFKEREKVIEEEEKEIKKKENALNNLREREEEREIEIMQAKKDVSTLRSQFKERESERTLLDMKKRETIMSKMSELHLQELVLKEVNSDYENKIEELENKIKLERNKREEDRILRIRSELKEAENGKKRNAELNKRNDELKDLHSRLKDYEKQVVAEERENSERYDELELLLVQAKEDCMLADLKLRDVQDYSELQIKKEVGECVELKKKMEEGDEIMKKVIECVEQKKKIKEGDDQSGKMRRYENELNERRDAQRKLKEKLEAQKWMEVVAKQHFRNETKHLETKISNLEKIAEFTKEEREAAVATTKKLETKISKLEKIAEFTREEREAAAATKVQSIVRGGLARKRSRLRRRDD